MASAPARPSASVDRQWIEDRFWVWVHYAGTKLGRGELFEVIGFLSYVRETVLGPMIMAAAGLPVRGVRRIEHSAPDAARRLALTVPTHDFKSCLSAVRASVDMYRQLRAASATKELVYHPEAEAAAVGYLERIATTVRNHPSWSISEQRSAPED